MRAILFPPPLDFAFYSDFLKSVRYPWPWLLMLDLNHLFLTIVISFLSFRVFLFLGLVGMSYSLWMWIRNGEIFIMLLYAPILFFTLTFKGKFCKYFYFFFLFLLQFFLNHFHFQGSFRECLLNSLDIFTFVVNPMLPPGGNFAENNSFWKVLTWIGSELNANSMQPWIDLKEKLL